MTRLINLTPHPVRIVGPGDEPIAELPGATVPARRAELTRRSGSLTVGRTAVPLLSMRYGPVRGLPDPAPDVLYVVSRLVADACPARDDLVVPADLVRAEDGSTIGCRAFTVGRAD